MRQLAVVRDYAELMDAIRARRDELDVTHRTIDDVAGLQDGYTSKLLAVPPIRRLGLQGMGTLLGALGLALVVVEDSEALRRVAGRLLKRRMTARYAQLARVEMLSAESRIGRGLILTGEKARKMLQMRNKKLSPFRRKIIARNAARAKHKKLWSKPRVVEVT